uniref:Uncharacterized protein n=1 Tax=Meleagris gallopavo TaxID=9103 RepID=A0A803XTF4_MELGA
MCSVGFWEVPWEQFCASHGINEQNGPSCSNATISFGAKQSPSDLQCRAEPSPVLRTFLYWFEASCCSTNWEVMGRNAPGTLRVHGQISPVGLHDPHNCTWGRVLPHISFAANSTLLQLCEAMGCACPLHQHRAHCTNTEPIAPTQCPLHQHRAHCTNTVPTAPTYCPLHQHRAHCTNTVPIAPTQSPLHQQCPLHQHSVHCTKTEPTAPTQSPLHQHIAHCTNTVPTAPTQSPLHQHNAHCTNTSPLHHYNAHCTNTVTAGTVLSPILAVMLINGSGRWRRADEVVSCLTRQDRCHGALPC